MPAFIGETYKPENHVVVPGQLYIRYMSTYSLLRGIKIIVSNNTNTIIFNETVSLPATTTTNIVTSSAGLGAYNIVIKNLVPNTLYNVTIQEAVLQGGELVVLSNAASNTISGTTSYNTIQSTGSIANMTSSETPAGTLTFGVELTNQDPKPYTLDIVDVSPRGVIGYPFHYNPVSNSLSYTDNSGGRTLSVYTSINTYSITHTYFTVRNLLANMYYNITLTIDPEGASPLVLTLSNIMAASPSQPQNVRARGVNGGIYMSWGDPSGGNLDPTSFKVYKVGGFFLPELIDTIMTTERSYLMTGLDNGTPYDVAIFSDAGNPRGTHFDHTAIISATPQLTPAAPVLQGTTDNNGKITLSWDNVSVPSGLTLSDYVIYFRLNGQDISGSMGLITTTTFNGIGIPLFAFGASHSFYLTARGSNGGEGPPSNTVSVTPRVVSLNAALAGGQSIASFVASSTQSAADIAVSSMAAVKQAYASDPAQKAAKLTTLFAALKAKAQEASPTAKTVAIASSTASGLADILTEKPANLPDKPTLIVVDPVISIEEMGDVAGSYIYFNMPQRFTKGTRWIEFSDSGTYTTSESATPVAFSMDSLVVAGGLALQLRALGTILSESQSVFRATLKQDDTTDTTISYILAGVDGATIPTSVSVTAEATYIPVAIGLVAGSTTTIAVTAAIIGSKLTMSGLSPNTRYRFTISADNYVPVSIGTTTHVGSVAPTGGPPLIQTEPANSTINAGESATFSVSAYVTLLPGVTPFLYQWKKNSIYIGDSNSASYGTNSGTNGDQYSVVLTNSYGSTTSRAATLTVNTPHGEDDPICFLAEAPVLTPAGYRPIASLSVGDAVMTADGRPVAIRAVKVMTCAAGPSANPYIIPRGLYSATEDLSISPRHRVAVGGGRMVEARELGLEQAKMSGVITYYNLELPNWGRDNLVVAGVEVESLAPVRRRAVSMAVFKRMIQRTYGGNVTPATMAKVLRVCRFLPNGDVEIPYMKRTA